MRCRAKSENIRTNVDCGRWTYCVVYGARGGGGEKKKSWIFIVRKKNEPFGNLHSNFDFLIITKNLRGLAAMDNACPHTARHPDPVHRSKISTRWPGPLSAPTWTRLNNFGDQPQRPVNQIHPRPTTAADLSLTDCCPGIGGQIPQASVNHLVRSMSRGCCAATAANGGHTCYWHCKSFGVC